MAILRITPECLAELLQLPPGATFIEARIQFDNPGVMLVKVDGAGWLRVEGEPITYADAAKIIRHADGRREIDWGLPVGDDT